jgi:hypothetical protein
MNPITIELNHEQAQQILQLADAAVRGGGLQFVRQAVVIMNLLDAAASAPPQVAQEESQ